MLASKVKKRQATLEEIASMERRVREKYEGPPVKKWTPTLSREQYFELRVAGKRREELILKYFNNESTKLVKQLRDWGIRTWKEEMTEVEAMTQGISTALTITKEEYLQRRAAGEGRMRIIRSLNVGQPRFFKLLESWGIREMDAEERALELLTPVRPANEVDRRTAEMVENKAMTRGLIAYNEKHATPDAPAPKPEPETESDSAHVAAESPVEPSADEREQELANLQAACALWKSEADKRFAENGALLDTLANNTVQLDRLREKEHQSGVTIRELTEDRDNWAKEYATLEEVFVELRNERDALNGRCVVRENQISELEAERNVLLQTIQRAVADSKVEEEPGVVTIRLPILPASIANAERLQIYNAVEALSFSVESAEIDRERVMRELFMLLQRTVSFVTADLAELLPGHNVSEHVQRFFSVHNDRHLAGVATTPAQAAG